MENPITSEQRGEGTLRSGIYTISEPRVIYPNSYE